VENIGMRVNMNKTKLMISGERHKVMRKAVRWPCGVCGRGVGNNSGYFILIVLIFILTVSKNALRLEELFF